MRALLLVFLCWTGVAQAADPGAQVVDLLVTTQRVDPIQPWTRGRPGSRAAHAVVISGNRLLTTAQMVADATLVRVGKHGGPESQPARVVHVDRDVNLALLTVDDPTWFDDLEPAKLAPVPPRGNGVTMVRWRNRQLETTSGTLGRHEVREARTGKVDFLALTVSADLPGGGWAEAVMQRGRLLGLVYSQSKQTAYVLPSDLIASYVEAVDETPYRGFAAPMFRWQVNRDPAVAGYLGLEGAPRGVIVREVFEGTTACGVLQPRDILLSLDGFDIDAEGFYDHPAHGRLRFTHRFVDGHRAGDVVPATVLRGGERVDLQLTLRPFRPPMARIPIEGPDAPGYVLLGGLVLREVDEEYLQGWGGNWKQRVDARLVTEWELGYLAQAEEHRRIVVLAYVLPDAYNVGYHDLTNLMITAINGQPVDRLADVLEALKSPDAGYHVLHFAMNDHTREVVLDVEGLDVATTRIAASYGIPEVVREAPAPPPLVCGAE